MRCVLRFCLAFVVGVFAGAGVWAQPTPPMPPPGLRGVLPDAATLAPKPMRFRLGRLEGGRACGLACAEFITAEGEIRADSFEALMVLAGRLKRPLPVVFNSPGGNLDGALALGRIVRSAGFDTRVAQLQPVCGPGLAECPPADGRAGVAVFAPAQGAAVCNSACVYAFAGGVSRTVGPGSSLGVHQYYLTRPDDPLRRPLRAVARADAARMAAVWSEVSGYLAAMGVSPETLRFADGAPPDQVRDLTGREMADLRLTTPAPRPPLSLAGEATGAITPRLRLTPDAPEIWPIIERQGRPFLVLSRPGDSRRFGAVTHEVAIGCAAPGAPYSLSFREIVAERPGHAQDARVLGAAGGDGGTISREKAQAAERDGVFVLDVVSSATAGYPQRLEYPAQGVTAGMARLDQACLRR